MCSDNSYAEGATPTLHMTASPTCLSFENNEVGFSERDCLAICNIGKSTKDPSAAGFIGNKGIGFNPFKHGLLRRVITDGFRSCYAV